MKIFKICSITSSSSSDGINFFIDECSDIVELMKINSTMILSDEYSISFEMCCAENEQDITKKLLKLETINFYKQNILNKKENKLSNVINKIQNSL